MGSLMKTVSKIYDTAKKQADKHSPEILAGLGIAGFFTSIILAIKVTSKAKNDIEEARNDKYLTQIEDGYDAVLDDVELTPMEVVKATWKDYLPVVGTTAASTLCIIGSVTTSNRRTAVLATAYKLAEESAAEYRAKVVETIGEKKEQKIREDIAQDRINNNPPQTTQVFITNQGNALCYDSYSGRYFKFDIDKLKKVNNEINERLLMENAVSLNELYLEWGLDGIDMGYEIGWSNENGLIDFQYTSKLTKDDEPCLVISFSPMPKPGYSYFYER